MSLGLIKPGMSAMLHPKTGEPLVPIYTRKNGTVVWPVLGASSDDPDDPSFTGEGDDDQDEDEEEDEEEDKPKPSRKKTSKSKSTKDDDEDEEDEDEDDEAASKYRASRQAKKYRLQLRAEQAKNLELADRLKAIEDKDKKPEELTERETREAKAKADRLEARQVRLAQENAFLKCNVVSWVDADDVLALAEHEGLFEDVIDEDGTVDQRELRRVLKDLAKRKPHLVKKDLKSDKADDDKDEDDEEPGSRRSASTMNGSRRGTKGKNPTRAELAKKFPVLGRL